MKTEHTYKSSLPSQMTRVRFLNCFGSVYESSPWIAETAWDLGKIDSKAVDSAEKLSTILSQIVDQASDKKKLALLNAHPDLAGKLAIAGKLTAHSTKEQAGADLQNCTTEEFNQFQKLNKDYKEKFGFPFILAVQGYQRSEILKVFQKRIKNSIEEEYKVALAQVNRIALLRLIRIEETPGNN